MRKLVVALVGRPNVGKSTLFNRLSINKKKKAIVHDKPGVTRDRKYADASIGAVEFIVVDTPGLEQAKEGSIEYSMTEQTISAIKMSDIVCLVVDAFIGITSEDITFANLVRKNNKAVILIANKSEKNIVIDKSYFKLGFGEPVQISAEHGLGMIDLCDRLVSLMDGIPHNDEELQSSMDSDKIKIAIVGRPNSGKSTFINAILNDQRLLTGEQAGITRDSIEIEWKYNGQSVTLVDTAGLRKRANIDDNLEKLSASDTVHSIRYANTVVLMLDSTRPLEKQDLNIASFVINEGRSLVIAVNKWDLISDKKAFRDGLSYKLSVELPQVEDVPCVYLSAIKFENITDVIDSCFEIYKIWNKKIQTSKLNEWINFATEYHQLPLQKNGKRVRIKYCAQVKARPPTFKFFCNKADAIPDSYKRYLLNDLRRSFDMSGVPIRMEFVSNVNPYQKRG